MKQILIVSFVIFFGTLTFGQNRFAIELSSFSNNLNIERDLISKENALGFGGKLVIEKPLNSEKEEYKAAFLSTGIEFANFRSKLIYDQSIINSDTINSDLEIDAKSLMITIPVTLKLRTNQFGLFTPFAQLGIEPTIFLNTDLDGLQVLPEETFDIQKIPLNIPLLISAGAEVSLTEQNSAYASLFYRIGLTNILQDKFDDEGDSQAIRLNNLGVRVGYLF